MGGKVRFIDLFAGCGGLSEGFLQSGKYEALAHVEWELPMVKTLRNRLHKKWKHSQSEAMKRVVHFDIQKTDELLGIKEMSKDSRKKFGKTNSEIFTERGLGGFIDKGSVDLVIGGPPCQAYSVAGRAQDKHSMRKDYRNYLFESFLKVVVNSNAKMFLFENVPGILSAKPGNIPVTERIFKAFENAGYEILNPHKIKDAVLNSADFGVAQKRKRIIIIGVNKLWAKKHGVSLENIYSQIKKAGRKRVYKTVKDAIGKLPKLSVNTLSSKTKSAPAPKNSRMSSDTHHARRFHNSHDIKIFKKWVVLKMNKWTNIKQIEFYNKTKNKSASHPKYRSLEWNKPSPTIVAHLNKDGLMFIHPDPKQARSITVREAALLQSFPKKFDFLGTMGYNYKMIGNAVPPLMAKGIAEQLYGFFKKHK